MSILLYPINNKHLFPITGKDLFQPLDKINLTYYLHKSVLDKIIHNVCIDFCNMTVFGYDKYNDKYWCKKFKNSRCILNLEIKILSRRCNETYINIEPKIGNKHYINLFVGEFNESIQMYTTSKFIRNILCKN